MARPPPRRARGGGLSVRRLAVALMLLAAPAAAQTTARFDGSWDVAATCSAEGGLGYTLRFNGQIRGGQFSGEYGGAPETGRLKLDGPVAPDGSATLRGDGEPPRDTRRNGRRSERWVVEAQFVGGHGTGRRTELRRCDLTFQRRR
jgi:hypothetical protein